MPTSTVMHVDPRQPRQSWPWRHLSLGDVVHVYAPPRLYSKVYAAGAYVFPHNHNLQIVTRKCADENGDAYIRCEVVDLRVHRAKQAMLYQYDAEALHARRAEEEALAQAQLAALNTPREP